MTRPKAPQVVTLAAIAAVALSFFVAKNIDFQAYWHGVGGFLRGTQPLYGPLSGVGYPQEFRYPPVTVLFFLPLTWLPMRAAGLLWGALGWALCAWAARAAIAKWKLPFTLAGGALGFVLAAQYVYLATKFGNVQPHLIALVLLSLLWADERPAWSGVALAVAICFKVWPLVFVPWFLIRGRRAALLWGGAASAVLWTAPALYFGAAQYVALLRDFYTHALAVASQPESIWYAGQSLRGLLFRFLTNTATPRDGYPDLSFAALSPALVGGINLAVSAAVYGAAVIAMWRAPAGRRWIWDAAAFVVFSILQTFCLNSGLISLLPAILAGASLYSAPPGQYPASVRRSYLAACALALVAVSNVSRSFQRLALMLGINFWIMLALGLALVFAATAQGSAAANEPQPSRGGHAGERPPLEDPAA